ncbi:hypothetical protein D3875_06160 [Deinococcus cavernae]|uniref:Uncharacterized protein n=1 Tax=Deinococcus cavernae TaxID=2320857 RepID=A0A418V530_9DEIO|nr:hypothetical protein [Deinococcus cavernae]RJF71216.1 hypothetical protein D3875_06160 [Deinococcus cavernae]
MTDPKKTGLPEDAGNEMSDRSGHYDESESGRVNTPTGGNTADSGPVPEDTLDPDGSGTTFDAGDAIPKR